MRCRTLKDIIRSGLVTEALTEQNGVVSLSQFWLRCAGRERCCPGRRQRQTKFSDRDRPEKRQPSSSNGPKDSTACKGLNNVHSVQALVLDCFCELPPPCNQFVSNDCVTLYTPWRGQCVDDSTRNGDWLRNIPITYYRNSDYEHSAYHAIIKS